MDQSVELTGEHIRLEPLDFRHIDGLVSAASADPSLYQWSPVPQGYAQARKYIDSAVAWKTAGTALPFATVCVSDGSVIGSTRFWNVEHWAWPINHPRHGCGLPDACEIGYSWLTRSAIKTAANTEAKLLMLTHAFETWNVLRVCFHTDARNERSGAALDRLGARFEGVLRSHRMAADFIPRDSLRFSIISSEWPVVKQKLIGCLRTSA